MSLIVQEIYGGGGTPGGQQNTATYNVDYVVIHNTSSAAVSLANHALQFQNGPGLGLWTVGDLTAAGSIPAFGYLLVALGPAGPIGDPLPVAIDFTLSTPVSIGANNGKVALTNTVTALNTTGTSTVGTLTDNSSVVDLVGYGNASSVNLAEGTRAPAPSATTAILRNAAGGWDTNNNSVDFQLTSGTWTPKNLAYTTPAFISAGTVSVIENTADVTDVNVHDNEGYTDNGGGVTYTIESGGDGALFSIDSISGILTFLSPPDYEAGSGSGSSTNQYIVTIRATDTAGATSTQTLAVNVQNVDAPQDSDTAANAINEGTTGAVGITASATDEDTPGNPITYSLVGDITGASSYTGPFAVGSSTGVVTLGSALDRESDGASQTVFIKALSSDGSFGVQSFTIAINDVDEFDVGAVTDADGAANAINENATGQVAVTALATDGDATAKITYSLVTNISGSTPVANTFAFVINASTGIVTLRTALDREVAGPTQSIFVKAQSSDGSFSVQSFTININDADEFDVGAVSDSDSATNQIDENQTGAVGLTAFASDADATNSTITYSLVTDVGGAYSGPFSIDSSSGIVSATAPLDFETDGATQTLYVKATSADGSSTTQQFTVAVNDVGEAVSTPADSNGAANTIAEGATGLVGITASAVDEDSTNNTVTYALVTDLTGATPYSGPFAIDAATGAVSLTAALDFEMAGATQTIFVKASSADGSSAVQSFTVSLTNFSPETILGTAAADTLMGGADRDLIFGRADRDKLFGLGGDDVLTGGAARDILYGGTGSDVFDFNSRTETGTTGSTRDRIADFKRGEDKIDLSGIDARGGVTGNQKFTWIGKQDFHDKKGELHYFTVNKPGSASDKTFVEGDVNGDGRADFVIEIAGLHKLGAGDFIL